MTIQEEAKKLIAEARAREKCLDLAKAAERRLEDLQWEIDHQSGWKLGVLGIVVGAVVAVAFLPVGIGIAVAGATGSFVAGTQKVEAIQKAAIALKRALEDLKECLSK